MKSDLYKKILNEIIQQNTISYKATDDEVKKGVNLNLPTGAKGFTMKKDPTGGYNINPTKESEMKESDKYDKKNPWAICTAQLGDEFKTTKRSEWTKSQKNKYERCVKDVKSSLKEGKDQLSLFLENKITDIVKKHIPPKITKRDLMKYLIEAPAPTIAPPKPKTEPKIAPAKPAEPQRAPKPRINPARNPNPGENPAPKAKSAEEAKDDLIKLIIDLMKNKN